MRAAALCCAVGISIACGGCESDKDRKARESAALQAKFSDELKRENADTARVLAERAQADREASDVRAVETHAESQDAFASYLRERPTMTTAEENTATDLGVARMRSRMPDPDATELRNARMNAAKTAVCAEVSYPEAGKSQTFRRAYVTGEVVSVEPPPEDVTHRTFEVNLKRIGCDGSAPAR